MRIPTLWLLWLLTLCTAQLGCSASKQAQAPESPVVTAQAQLPDRVSALLRAALEPLADESMALSAAHCCMPGLGNAIIVTAQRVPPFGFGEDVRPATAAVIVTERDTVLLKALPDLPSAWRVIYEASDAATKPVETLISLLVHTRLIPEPWLFLSEQHARDEILLSMIDDPSVLERIHEPRLSAEGSRKTIRLFSRSRFAIYQHEISIDESGNLALRTVLLSRLRPSI
jgi:hypothetical protein